MRLPTLAALVLICFSTSLSQPKPVVRDKGNFGLHVVNDSISQHKYLEQQNQLLLIGSKHLQLLDLTNFKVIETRPIELPWRDRLPDSLRTRMKPENKPAASILDLQTGKRLAQLAQPERIRSAMWSKNGKMLMTKDAFYINSLTKTLNASFWDGDSR